MTDGDGAEIEPGTTQPVPPSFDGTSPTSDGDEVSAAEHQNKDERDLFGGNRPDDDSSPRQMEGEVDMQAEHMVFPGQPDVNSPDNLHHGASAPRMGLNFRGNHLSENESKILDSMVNQAMLSASLNDGLQLPWETGVMASIFGDAPLASVPSIPSVAHNMDDQKRVPGQEIMHPGEPQPKRQRVFNSTYRMYERAIQFKNVLTDHDSDEVKWSRALEKLYTVMISSPGTAPTGVRFQDGHMDLNLRQIRVLCGSRSPNTVAKRATSLMKYCMWHRGFFYKRNPLPLDSEEAQSTFGRNTKTGWPTAP